MHGMGFFFCQKCADYYLLILYIAREEYKFNIKALLIICFINV